MELLSPSQPISPQLAGGHAGPVAQERGINKGGAPRPPSSTGRLVMNDHAGEGIEVAGTVANGNAVPLGDYMEIAAGIL
jgi:hypothetical protein